MCQENRPHDTRQPLRLLRRHLPLHQGRQGGRRNAAGRGPTAPTRCVGAVPLPPYEEMGNDLSCPLRGHPPLKGRAFGKCKAGVGQTWGKVALPAFLRNRYINKKLPLRKEREWFHLGISPR